MSKDIGTDKKAPLFYFDINIVVYIYCALKPRNPLVKIPYSGRVSFLFQITMTTNTYTHMAYAAASGFNSSNSTSFEKVVNLLLSDVQTSVIVFALIGLSVLITLCILVTLVVVVIAYCCSKKVYLKRKRLVLTDQDIKYINPFRLYGSPTQFWTGDLASIYAFNKKENEQSFVFLQLNPDEFTRSNIHRIKQHRELNLKVLCDGRLITTSIYDLTDNDILAAKHIQILDKINIDGLSWTAYRVSISKRYTPTHKPIPLVDDTIIHDDTGMFAVTSGKFTCHDMQFYSVLKADSPTIKQSICNHLAHSDNEYLRDIYNNNIILRSNKAKYEVLLCKPYRTTRPMKKYVTLNPLDTEQPTTNPIILEPKAKTHVNPVMQPDQIATPKECEQNMTTNGCTPVKGIHSLLYAYFARYFNVFTYKTPDPSDLKYSEEFKDIIFRRVGVLSPQYSQDAQAKYAEYLCADKLNTMFGGRQHEIFVKGEQYTKFNRNRVITNCNKNITVNLLRYVYPLHLKLRDHIHCYAPGKPKSSFNTHLIPAHLGCDYSGLDGSIPRSLRAIVETILYKIFPGESKDLAKFLDSEFFGDFIINHKEHKFSVPTNGSRLSGSALTSIMNTLIVMFLQYYYYRHKCNYAKAKAFDKIGWCYGDDTTMPENHILPFSKFVKDKYGMTVTIEKSKSDGITFLSELKTCDGTQHDFDRLLKKYSTSFNKFNGHLSLLYKDLGYYNPKKPISDKTSTRFAQVPGFSLVGKFAYGTLKQLAKFKPGVSLEAHLKRATDGPEAYNIYDAHELADYTIQKPNIIDFHREVLDLYMSFSKKIATSADDAVNIYHSFKEKYLDILIKYYAKEIAVYPSKHGTMIVDGHVFDTTKFKLNVRSAYYMIGSHIDLYNEGGKFVDEALTSLHKHTKFWYQTSKFLKGDLGAAAKEIYNIFERYYKYAKKLNKTTPKKKWRAQCLQKELEQFQSKTKQK